jgi:hypothetical protein
LRPAFRSTTPVPTTTVAISSTTVAVGTRRLVIRISFLARPNRALERFLIHNALISQRFEDSFVFNPIPALLFAFLFLLLLPLTRKWRRPTQALPAAI